MMILKETIYDKDGGEPNITEKPFGSKNEIIKVLKRLSPLPGKVIYELSKYGEVYFEIFESKRKMEIFNPVVNEREVVDNV